MNNLRIGRKNVKRILFRLSIVMILLIIGGAGMGIIISELFDFQNNLKLSIS
jgi:hypothetical protein